MRVIYARGHARSVSPNTTASRAQAVLDAWTVGDPPSQQLTHTQAIAQAGRKTRAQLVRCRALLVQKIARRLSKNIAKHH